MTDSDLLELDIWIAEKFMGWSRIDGPTYGPSWVDKDKRIITREVTSFPSPFMPSSDPSAFALVKREIERRGWEWACAYERPTERLKSAYTFTVYVIREPETNAPTCYDKLAASEELAGCLVVKAAVEAISSSILT